MTDPNDLSAGVVPERERNFAAEEIKENSHRLFWKNLLLTIAAAFVIAFYITFLILLYRSFTPTEPPNPIPWNEERHDGYLQYVLLTITAVVPTLLLLKILGLIAYAKRQEKEEVPPLSPFLEMLRKLGNALIEKIGGGK